MARIEFTDNYQDLSTDTGYQFKFFCESCGNGYMSSWQANKIGMAGEAAARRRATSWAGSSAGPAHGAYEIQRAVGGPEHDRALEAAVAEIKPLFVQCKRCGQWVCQRDLLERRARPLQELRADPAARAGRQAGRDHRRAGRGEAAPAGPHRGGQRRRARPWCTARLRRRDQRRASSARSAAAS